MMSFEFTGPEDFLRRIFPLFAVYVFTDLL
jgi:hypothetical protein